MSNVERKNKVLGISISSASMRLRKMILFDLLKRHNENTCYRCGTIIDDVDDLSLDHKIDWLNAPNARELYWDINNIAFSHLTCNSASGGSNGGKMNLKLTSDERVEHARTYKKEYATTHADNIREYQKNYKRRQRCINTDSSRTI